MRQAVDGIDRLREQVDTMIVIPNEKLLAVVERRTSILEAFREADNVLGQGVQGITDLITTPGLINLDFADVRTIMQDAGSALMGIGEAAGENRSAEAAKNAVSSPLLEQSVEGATGILLNITGGSDLGLFEVNEAAGDHPVGGRPELEHHLRGSRRRRAWRQRARDRDRHGLRARQPDAALHRGLNRPPARARAATSRWTIGSASRSRSPTTKSTSRRSSATEFAGAPPPPRHLAGCGDIPPETGLAFEAMRELRTHYEDEATFVTRVDVVQRPRATGWWAHSRTAAASPSQASA